MRFLGFLVLALLVASAGPAAAAPSLVTPTNRDGHNDFSFLHGKWHTHYRILRHRLKHDTHWDDCPGESLVTPFWDNHGNLEIGSLNCPAPRGLVDALTLRTYSAETHQWNLWWGTKKLGVVPPPQVGHFDSHGVGRFYADDTWEGTPVIVRFQWNVANGLPHFEQAFSTDRGTTWETNWICDYTRA